jgi:hypothetical protein
MAVKVDDSFAKEQKQSVKLAMKGRPLHFGLQAQAAKKGKFLISRKPAEVKPARVKEITVYVGDGKDAKKAEAMNTVPGGAACGVALGENGVLKLYFERGKALPAAEKFVRYFVVREIKFKAVKRVEIVEVDLDKLPKVEENDPKDQPPTKNEVELDYSGLQSQLSTLKVADPVKKRLEAMLEAARLNLDADKPEEADNDLLALKATVQLLQQIDAVMQRAKVLRDLLETAKKSGKLNDAQHQVEALVSDASLKLTAAANAVAADDDDVEAAAADDLRAAEKQVAEAEKLNTGGAGGGGNEDADQAAFFTDWVDGLKETLKATQLESSIKVELLEHIKVVTTALQAYKKKKPDATGDWTAATAAYKAADALLSSASRGGRSGNFSDSVAQWKKVRAAAVKGTEDLAQKLRDTKDKRALDIADVVQLIGKRFPSRLDTLLDSLTKAQAARDADLTAQLEPQVQDAIKECLKYVKDNAKYVEGCEQNPFDVKVDMTKPVQLALKALLQAVA